MGEIAEMMLDGTLCQECGVLMDDHDAPGFPRTCSDCLRDFDHPVTPKVTCPICSKRVKAVGLADHQRDVHGTGVGVSEEERR